MEIRVDQEGRRYVSRLLSGFGEGTEIWTYLEPVGPRDTHIRVEFNLPIAEPDKARRVGEAYKQLYSRLWDEDIEMMRARQDFLDRRPRPLMEPVVLGTLAQVRSKLPMTLMLGDEKFRVVEIEGKLIAFACLCPHMQGPLDQGALDGTVVTCPWHGYRFNIIDGRNVDGKKLKLRRRPQVVVDVAKDEVRLEWQGFPS
jgi:nitrite reductase (NADH) small subunit